MTPTLEILLAKNKQKLDAMTEQEIKDMLAQQAISYAKAEASWPKPKFKYQDGVKVYESYEDYCND